jgi:hypothetical protein
MLRQIRSLQGQPIDSLADLNAYVLAKRRLVRQQQVARVNDHYSKAVQAFSQGELDKARIELENADLIMAFDPYQTDFGSLAQDVPSMLTLVKRRLDQAAKAEEEEQFQVAYDELKAEEDRREKREWEQVRLWMIEGLESFQRQDFDNAEFLARKVLKLRPGFPKAKELLEVSEKARNAAWRESFYNQRRERYQSWLEEVRAAQVPHTGLLTWADADWWSDITRKRRRGDVIDIALEETEAVRRIKAKLANETITLDFGETETTFSEAIRHIRSTQDINIVIDGEVETEKGEEPVRITLINQNLGTAIKTMLELLDLASTFRDDVLYITSKDKALGKPLPRVYEVRDLTVSLPHFKAPNLTLRPGGAGEAAQRAIWGEDLERTQDTSLDRLVDLIRENVDPLSWDGEGFALQPSSGQIVAVTTPAIHRKVETFLNDLRKFTKLTVNVEARFISIQKGYFSDIGVDFRGTGGTSPGVIALLDDITNGPPNNASAGLDNGQPGLPAASSLSPASGAFYNDGSDGDLRARTENIFDRALGQLLTGRGGLTLGFSILDDTEIQGLFRAIEKNLDTTLVNAPRLTIYNNQRANLTLVNQVSYVKDYDVEVAQTAFIADPLVDVVQDGLTLDVKPTVSHDRKYVTLEVQPTLATLFRPIRTFETNLSGLTTPVVIELPEIRYSSAATTVRVPDGGYVVIGGLKYVTTVDRRSETPILSNIPILSFLFTRKGRSDEIRDLIIVLHVNILDLTEQENDLVN